MVLKRSALAFIQQHRRFEIQKPDITCLCRQVVTVFRAGSIYNDNGRTTFAISGYQYLIFLLARVSDSCQCNAQQLRSGIVHFMANLSASPPNSLDHHLAHHNTTTTCIFAKVIPHLSRFPYNINKSTYLLSESMALP